MKVIVGPSRVVAAAALAVIVAACGSGRSSASPPPAAGGTPLERPGAAPAHPGVPRSEHPRVLVTPAQLADLRARSGDADVAAVVTQADRVLRYGLGPGYQGEGWSSDGPVLGLAYLLTGDARYAKPLLRMLDQLNAAASAGDLGALSADSTFGSRSTALALALAFDWIYPELGEARRAATIRTVNAYFDWFLHGDRVRERNGPAYGNYFGGHLLGFGAMGHATHGDNPRAPEIIAKVRSLFDANVPASFASGPSEGGFPVEGYVYGANTFVRILQYVRLVQTSTGEAIPGTGPWASRVARTMVHALKPNRWQLVDEGEYTGDTTGFLNPDQLRIAAAIADDPATRSHAAWLLAHRGSPAQGSLPAPSAMTRLLYPLPDAPVDYRGVLPPFHAPAGAALLLARSGWDDSAVWVSFNAGMKRWTDHVGRQAGHFTLQRGSDYLLVNGHQWKQNKVYRSNALVGFDGPGYLGNTFVSPTSAWTNTLFVDDGPGGYLLDGENYRGGQGGFSENQPFVASQHPDVTYVKSDATRAYANNHPGSYDRRAVRLFVRNFAYLAPGTVVVLDRVRTASPSMEFGLRFHLNSNAPPKLEANVASSTVGASRLFLRAVLPEGVKVAAAWQPLDGANFVPRVDLRPPAPAEDMDALTVLTVAGKDVSAAPEARIIRSEGGSMLGVQVLDPRGELVALFAKADTDRVPGEIAYALPSTRARHYLFDLQPSRSYSVVVSDAPGARIVVVPAATGISTDAAGVLAFDLDGGKVSPLPRP